MGINIHAGSLCLLQQHFQIPQVVTGNQNTGICPNANTHSRTKESSYADDKDNQAKQLYALVTKYTLVLHSSRAYTASLTHSGSSQQALYNASRNRRACGLPSSF